MKALLNRKRNMVLAVAILLIAASFFAVHSKTIFNHSVTRVRKMEDAASRKTDLTYFDSSLSINGNLYEIPDSQSLDESEFLIMLSDVKNMLTLFSKLIIILFSFIFVFQCIRRWILLESNLRSIFYNVHYLQVQDGKKDTFSFQLSTFETI